MAGIKTERKGSGCVRERWIVVSRWRGKEGFQHYGSRDPIWVKNYTRLLRKDEYMNLTPPQRALLHGLWLLYASKRGEIRESTCSLSRELGMRVTKQMLESLNHAGFIRRVASRSLALRYWSAIPEQEKEEEIEKETVGKGTKPRKVTHLDPRRRRRDDSSRYTGCRQTRGAGGFGYVYDPLGIDFPPSDWPHAAPTVAEILEAIEKQRAA